MDRGYAVLVYEGPGQGQVIKSPPYMPFYPEWEDVFLVILDYVQNNLTEYVLTDKIAQNGRGLPAAFHMAEMLLCNTELIS